ncbi:hypothetical protein [Rhizobium sp. LjRoot258]|uniref:hypothetical protein n=1 Tax=Rhizobium sp. LjRoot258 TaxID=3342299 RepID=UPI003ECF046F
MSSSKTSPGQTTAGHPRSVVLLMEPEGRWLLESGPSRSLAGLFDEVVPISRNFHVNQPIPEIGQALVFDIVDEIENLA